MMPGWSWPRSQSAFCSITTLRKRRLVPQHHPLQRGTMVTSKSEIAPAIQGQLLRLSERREVAIYLRGGMLWIADFIDGSGELVDPAEWFRFNCGTHSARRTRDRML